jgi:succinate-acetate transporter protein
MTTIEQHIEPAPPLPAAGKGPPAAAAATWGNAAPLALAAFAVTTFMLSMINAGLVPKATEPVVFGVALMFGGVTQLIAGLIVLRGGNTFGGVLFCGFGAFWLSLFAIAQFFLKDIPPAQAGHALGLFVFAFGIFIVWMFAASFRTNVVVVAALADLVAVFAVLGSGLYAGNAGLVKAGGWLGLVAAALAAYLSFAEMCEATYGREIFPIGHLAKH